MRLYADNARCSGCSACLAACSYHLFGQITTKRAALRVIPHFPVPGGYTVQVCTQCGECAAGCPTDAIVQNDLGAYHVVPELCTLCMACVDACPEGVVFFREDVPHTWECDLCGECIQVCGMDVLRLAE
jgi:ferredoxin